MARALYVSSPHTSGDRLRGLFSAMLQEQLYVCPYSSLLLQFYYWRDCSSWMNNHSWVIGCWNNARYTYPLSLHYNKNERQIDIQWLHWNRQKPAAMYALAAESTISCTVKLQLWDTGNCCFVFFFKKPSFGQQNRPTGSACIFSCYWWQPYGAPGKKWQLSLPGGQLGQREQELLLD